MSTILRLGVRLRSPLVLPLLLVSLVAAGCFRTETRIELDEDGSGTVGFLIAMDMRVMEGFDELAEELGDLEDDDFDAGMAENPFLEDFEEEDLPPGSTVEPYEENGLVGVVVRVPFEFEDDVVGAIGDLFGVVSDDEELGDDGFESFRLERDGDQWVFEAVLLAGDDDLAAEDPAEAAFVRALFPDEPYILSIRLPGVVTDHNADRVEEDGTLVWSIDIFSQEARHMSATSELDGVPAPAADTTEPPMETTETTTAPDVDDTAAPVDEASPPVEEEGGLGAVAIAAIVAAVLAGAAAAVYLIRRANTPADAG